MVITVDKLSDAPLYLQLRDSVIAGIAAGELRPGDALPSVRSLAENLGINLHTVNKAYATLRDEGYGYAIIGSAGPVDFYNKCVGATVIEGSVPGIYANLI